MRSMIQCLLLSCFLALSINAYSYQAQSETENEIKKTVENFCNMEFQGKLIDEERGTLVRYTPTSDDYKISKILAKNALDGEHLYPYEWDLEKHPFFIVDSYNIVAIKQIDETHAYAMVNYRQLARVEKDDSYLQDLRLGNFIKDIRDITIRLDIISNDCKPMKKMRPWLIVNPPYPKVSYDTVFKYYSNKAANTHLRIIGKEQPTSKKLSNKEVLKYTATYNNEKSILDFLSDLKKQQQIKS